MGEEVKQECLRANSTRTEMGYYIGMVVTPHFSGQLRPGPTVAVRGHVESTSWHLPMASNCTLTKVHPDLCGH